MAAISCPSASFALSPASLALPVAASLVAPDGYLALLIGSSRLETVHKLLPSFAWQPPQPLPLSDARVLLVGKLGANAAAT